MVQRGPFKLDLHPASKLTRGGWTLQLCDKPPKVLNQVAWLLDLTSFSALEQIFVDLDMLHESA